MRGLRLRKHNIQIGDENALQKLFKEDRGNSYFVGEVFALNNNLIPNSQRDYFNQNDAREEFELALKQYFDNEMQKTYYFGSFINSRYDKIDKYTNLREEFSKAEKEGFAGSEHKGILEEQLKTAEIEAQKAHDEIQKKFSKVLPDTLVGKVAKVIQKRRENAITQKPVAPANIEENIPKNKSNWRTNNLSNLNKKERKLVGKIYDIIFSVVEKEIAEKIVCKIEEALK